MKIGRIYASRRWFDRLTMSGAVGMALSGHFRSKYKETKGEGERMAETTIILYGTSWCPMTARAKRYLTECGAEFTWCDIEEDPVGCAYVEKVNQGNRSVPTILVPGWIDPGGAEQ